MSDRNRMPPISNLENCQSVGKVYKLFCKIRIAGLNCAFCKCAWKLREAKNVDLLTIFVSVDDFNDFT